MVTEERLAAIGRLAAGFAHDLNNSLAPVVGFSELLLSDGEGGGLSARQREWLELIHRGALDAAGTVSRLREAYRTRAAREAYLPVDVTELFQLVAALTRPMWRDAAGAAGKTITVLIETNEALSPSHPLTPALPLRGCSLLADEDDLREALANLISNAVDAILEAPGARGTIALRGYTTAELGTQAVAIEVADTGIGMSEEARERCLEPFYTTKAERGTGLGLSLVHGTVQRHNGRIEIKSGPEVGTTVRLILPAAETAAAMTETAAEMAATTA